MRSVLDEPVDPRMAEEPWLVGLRLEGVEVLRELGRGAATVVYRARRDGRDYAVKVQRMSGGDREQEHAAFRREAAMLASLRHPGLVRIHEVGDAGGHPYLIMDMIEGRSLRAAIDEAPLDERQTVAVAIETAEALAVAHHAGLVHRDLKPANIMLGHDGRVTVIDFGLATRADVGGAVSDSDSVAGTFLYSPPEQTGLLHRAVDGRADLYSLGAVLYECLAHRPPFEAADAGELIRSHLAAKPPPLRAARPDIAPALVVVVERLLAKDPDDRYQSCSSVVADLRRILAGHREVFDTGRADTGNSGDPALVGRDDVVPRLLDRWTAARGGTGGLVVIEGGAGAGKSRLAREVTGRARRDGAVVLAGKAVPASAPLALVRAALVDHLRRIRQLPDGERGEALAALRSAAGSGAAMLPTLLPELGELLQVERRQADDERQFADAIARLLAGMAAPAGAVLHLDDVQWCDDATIRVLRQLVPLLSQTPLLVVATARDDAESRAAMAAFHAEFGACTDERITVGPLTDAAVAELVVRQLGGGSVPPDLVSRLAACSGGNPLAAQEYVRAVVDAGLIRPSWGSWVLDAAGLDALALPDDVMGIVVRRVESLGPTARELLTVAAVSGSRFHPMLLALVCGLEPVAGLAACADATTHHLIEPVGSGRYAFLHDRIREGLLSQLDEAARRRLHQRIALVLDESPNLAGDGSEGVYATARHHLAGEVRRTVWPAFTAAVRAGELALAEYASRDALDFLLSAVAIGQEHDLAVSADTFVAVGIAAVRIGRFALADEHFHRALAVQPDPVRRARIFRELAVSHHMNWRGELALAMIREGLAELGHPLPRNPAAMALRTVVLFVAGVLVGLLPQRRRLVTGPRAEMFALRADLLNSGAQSAAFAMRQPIMAALNMQALLLVNRLPRGRSYADTQCGLAVVANVIGWRRQAARMLKRAREAAVAISDSWLVAHVDWMHGPVYDVAPPIDRDTGRAMRRAAEQHADALDTGEYLTAIGTFCQIAVMRGYTDEAMSWYLRGRSRAGNSSEVLGNIFATVGAQAAALAGRPADATAHLEEVRRFVRALPDNRAQAVNLAVAEVQILVEQGETGAAFDEAVERFTALRVAPRFLWSFQRPLWVYVALGRIAQAHAAPAELRTARLAAARRAVRELRRVANGPVMRAFQTAAAAALRHLEGDHRGALRLLARAEVRDGGLDLPLLNYETARVRARAWRDLHRPDEVRRHASAALVLAQQHGWQMRARWIVTEFGLAAWETAPGMATASRHSTKPGPGEMSGGSARVLQALRQLSVAASAVLDTGQLSRAALDEIVRIFGAERAFLFLHEDDGSLVPYMGRDEGQNDLVELVGYGSTLVDRVAVERRALVITGSEQGAVLGSQSTVVHGLRSIMVAPLLVRGRMLGVVYLDSRAAKGIFTDDDVDILAAITTSIAASLETTRAVAMERAMHAARRERDVAEALRAAMNDFTATLDPSEVGRRLADRIAATLPQSTVTLLRPSSDDAPDTFHTLEVGPDGVVTDLVTLAPPAVARLAVPGTDLARPAGIVPTAAAWFALPLSARGERPGLVVVHRTGPDFTSTEIEITAALAGQGAAALDNALLFHQVTEIATRDALTGLFNRRHFFEVGPDLLRGTGRESGPCAVMVDIDHFKMINDRYGHGAGDDVIRDVARRIATAVREVDLVCRYGGEEFAVLLADISSEDACRVADRMHAAVGDEPVATREGDIPVTASVGLAAHDGEATLDQLLGAADQALYEAKRGGRNRVVVVAGDLQTRDSGRVS